jgi:hypothetical protein
MRDIAPEKETVVVTHWRDGGDQGGGVYRVRHAVPNLKAALTAAVDDFLGASAANRDAARNNGIRAFCFADILDLIDDATLARHGVLAIEDLLIGEPLYLDADEGLQSDGVYDPDGAEGGCDYPETVEVEVTPDLIAASRRGHLLENPLALALTDRLGTRYGVSLHDGGRCLAQPWDDPDPALAACEEAPWYDFGPRGSAFLRAFDAGEDVRDGHALWFNAVRE